MIRIAQGLVHVHGFVPFTSPCGVLSSVVVLLLVVSMVSQDSGASEESS